MSMSVGLLPSSSDERRRLSAPGLKAFFRIAEAWGLSAQEQRVLLGQPARSTFYAWRAHPEAVELSPDTLERVSYLLGIYKALHVLLADPPRADGWLRRPNDAPLFGGRPALEKMLSGRMADLYEIRRYLEAETQA